MLQPNIKLQCHACDVSLAIHSRCDVAKNALTKLKPFNPTDSSQTHWKRLSVKLYSCTMRVMVGLRLACSSDVGPDWSLPGLY